MSKTFLAPANTIWTGPKQFWTDRRTRHKSLRPIKKIVYTSINGHYYFVAWWLSFFSLSVLPSLVKRGDIWTNVSSVVEFQRWWVLKCKIFAQELTCSKETIVFWEYGEHQFVKSAEIVLSKSIFYVKNQRNFFKKKIHLRISI